MDSITVNEVTYSLNASGTVRAGLRVLVVVMLIAMKSYAKNRDSLAGVVSPTLIALLDTWLAMRPLFVALARALRRA